LAIGLLSRALDAPPVVVERASEAVEGVRDADRVLVAQVLGREPGLDHRHQGATVAGLERELQRGLKARAVGPGRGSLALPRRALDEPLEAIETPVPRAAIGVDPRGRLVEAGRSEPALARPPDLLGHDEVGALEDADVLPDPVERQPVRPRELADRGRAAGEALEDPAPGRVREGEEGPVELR